MHFVRHLKCVALLATGVLSMDPQSALAADMSRQVGGMDIQAVGSETVSYQSNPLMLTSGAKSLFGSVTAPELILSNQDPTAKYNVDTTLDENIFDNSDFNSTDVHLRAGIDTTNQRWSAGIKETTDFDTTRTSELSTYGIAIRPVRHVGLSVTPDVAYNFTAVDKLALQASFANAHYDSSIYTNFETFTVAPSYTRSIDPNNAAVLNVQAQRYRSINGLRDVVDSVGPSIGWITTLTPRLSGKVNIGEEATRQYGTGIVSQPWTLHYTFSTGVSFAGQEDKTDLTASRAQYPFGNGTDSLLTSITLTDIHNLNANFALNGGLGYQSATYQANAIGNLTTQYSGNVGLTYHFSEHIDATTGYQYRFEKLNGIQSSAQDNMIMVGAVYRPTAWAF